MNVSMETLSLVRQAARQFAERHRPRLCTTEPTNSPTGLPADIIAELLTLGWLDRTGAEDELPVAALLGTLVFELARVSPELAARLLCYHYANVWLSGVGPTPSTSPATSLYAVPAFEPQPSQKDGTLTMVVGLPEAQSLLCRTKSVTSEPLLLCVPATFLHEVTPVRTLGLTRLGIVDVKLPRAPEPSDWVIARGKDVENARTVALRAIAGPYVCLCRAVIATSRQTAQKYASERRQGGRRLSELPEVRHLLEVQERAETLTLLVEHALNDEASAAVPFATVRQALLDATDAGLQILGGAGYVVGTGQERLWRDAHQLVSLLLPPWSASEESQ